MEYCRIAPDVKLGSQVQLHAFVNLYGCTIGDYTSIGTFVEIQKNAHIGNYCKISSHTFICEGVTVGDRVFIGHNVTFINDLYPRAVNKNGALQDESDWQVVSTVIEDGVSIGSSVTILCGITVGKNSMIGAGSIVLEDVPAGQLWVGNPARFVRNVEEIS